MRKLIVKKIILFIGFCFLFYSCEDEIIKENNKENDLKSDVKFIDNKDIANHFLKQIYSTTGKIPTKGKSAKEQEVETKKILSDFFEEKAMDITSEKGIKTQTLILKKDVKPEDFLKGKALENYIKSKKNDCLEKPKYNFISCNTFPDNYHRDNDLPVSSDNYGGNQKPPVTFVSFEPTYYGYIETTFVDVGTGDITTSFTPTNTYDGGFDNGSNGGGFFNGIWTGIKSFFSKAYNGFIGLFKADNCKCKGSGLASLDTKSSMDNVNEEDCCKGDAGMFSYEILLPKELLEQAKQEIEQQPRTKNQRIEIEDTTEVECACKNNNNLLSIGKYLGVTEAESLFLANKKQDELRKKICEFLEKNKYSDEARQFAKNVVKTKNPNVIVDFKRFIINNLTNSCARTIFEQLRSETSSININRPEIHLKIKNKDRTLNFSAAILKLFHESSETHYTIQNGELSNTNAQTINSITTISNNYLRNATTLSIARTMIHEQIHAYLEAMRTWKKDFRYRDFYFMLKQFYEDNNREYGDNNPRYHHEFMGQYVDAMAYSLYQWDKNYGSGVGKNVMRPDDLLGWDYYKSMAYAGLVYKDEQGNYQDTDSFKELVPNQTDRNRIKNIIVNESEGKSRTKGTKCNF